MRALRSAWVFLLLLAVLIVSMRAWDGGGHPSPVMQWEGVHAIDPRLATPGELRFLPGIGPKLARSMHHEIRLLGIDSLDELERLSGIGPARSAAILDAVGLQ